MIGLATIVASIGLATFTQASISNRATPQHKVTFIDLGSEYCIPCQKMVPVMDSIKSLYPNDVKVIFYNVSTKEGRPFAEKYHIEMIPTQIFLDKNGMEYFRHQGYFPIKEVVKILKKKGVDR